MLIFSKPNKYQNKNPIKLWWILWVCSYMLPYLEKKLCWPVDEVSPSYESLCLRLSGGPPCPFPSLGAEISMLLLLSLLLELRPGLDSPSRPELSWEKGGECAAYCKASYITVVGNYIYQVGVDAFSLVNRKMWKREKRCLGKCESIKCERIWMAKGRRREAGSNRLKMEILRCLAGAKRLQMTSCSRRAVQHRYYDKYVT